MPEAAAEQTARIPRTLAGVCLALAAVGAAVLAAGCAAPARRASAAGHQHPASTARATRSGPATSAPATGPAAASPTARAGGFPTVIPVPPPPAGLPQTRAFPSAHTPVFTAEMTDLWAAVTTGRARLAAQAFFPLAAYTKVKAISDPVADWHSRLYGDFRLDVTAAHDYLGPGARRARLVRVIVPSAEAAWINPRVCYNAVGYWHVGGARLVYRQDGQLRSIGVASLISWRGRWYVVHFGAVLRTGAAGVVDQPAAGPGPPGPAGGC